MKLAIQYEVRLERQIKIFFSTTHTQFGSNKNFVTRNRAANTRKITNMPIDNRKLNRVVMFGTSNMCAPLKEKKCLICGLGKNFEKLCRRPNFQNSHTNEGPKKRFGLKNSDKRIYCFPKLILMITSKNKFSAMITTNSFLIQFGYLFNTLFYTY